MCFSSTFCTSFSLWHFTLLKWLSRKRNPLWDSSRFAMFVDWPHVMYAVVGFSLFYTQCPVFIDCFIVSLIVEFYWFSLWALYVGVLTLVVTFLFVSVLLDTTTLLSHVLTPKIAFHIVIYFFTCFNDFYINLLII